MDSVFLFLLLAVFSDFYYLLSELISSKRQRKAKDFFPGPSLASKQAFFCCLNLENCSTISRIVVVLVTIVKPHVGPLMILRILAHNTGFLLSSGSEEGLGPLVRLIFSKFSKR
jgi:hypothetical protein